MNDAPIKDIISNFLKQPAENITSVSRIDRTTIASSIILHRMYAKLAEAGFETGDYSGIQTYGQLLARLSRNPTNGDEPAELSIVQHNHQAAAVQEPKIIPEGNVNSKGIGIDIEMVATLPKVEDFREASFYRLNFAQSEISYCILQPDPYASFAGLFAAKEAMVKADNSLRNRTFNQIVVGYSESGAPQSPGFSLSISHVEHTAVAVAIPMINPVNISSPGITLSKDSQGSNGGLTFLISVLALILGAISLILVLKD